LRNFPLSDDIAYICVHLKNQEAMNHLKELPNENGVKEAKPVEKPGKTVEDGSGLIRIKGK
jgi:hypothetical protein